MYIRTVKAKGHEYLQLAHNVRNPKTGVSKADVLYSFGRKDSLDVEELHRLVKSISRFLDEDEVKTLQDQTDTDVLEFIGARAMGGTWLLQGLWQRMGIGQALKQLLKQREYQTPVERMIFAMVANRALAPSSKLHTEHWVAEDAYIPGLPTVEVHQLYRAMDFLLEASEDIQREVFFSVANLFNLEVDLLFLDTTTTYFEVEQEDAGDDGLRKRSQNSKDKRPDLPQIAIAFAVTRTGIPVRCWVWQGNQSDQNVIDEVKRDLNQWKLGRVVMVQDTGFNSEKNRRTLQTAGGHYIIGEKLHQGKYAESVEALKRAGKYKTLANGLEIKEVVVGGDSEARRRFVLVRNPEEAERDRIKREDIVKEAERRLDELKQLAGEPHKKAACALRSHPAYGRYLRQTKTGKLMIDKGKMKDDAHFDGKYLVSTSDDGLSAEDVVLGYKQLFEIERVFRDLKHLVDIRPVRHRLEDRIRAHVLLCWMAMLLIRVAENETKQTWFQLKKILSSLQLGQHRTRTGEVWQTGKIRDELRDLMTILKVEPPPRYIQIGTLDTENA
jgi:hypothetical protein